MGCAGKDRPPAVMACGDCSHASEVAWGRRSEKRALRCRMPGRWHGYVVAIYPAWMQRHNGGAGSPAWCPLKKDD